MIAVDTNVLVRFLVAADGGQSESAKALFARNTVAVAHTVLLETEWVLRRNFRFGRERIAQAFRDLFGMESILSGEVGAVLVAVEAMEAGCDFADALHAVTSASGADLFVTFDRRFANRAARIEGLPPVRLLRSGGRIATD